MVTNDATTITLASGADNLVTLGVTSGDQYVIHPYWRIRDVFGPALRSDAVAVIIGHNHPSGDPSPSRADRVVTSALRNAGSLLGVPVLDHLIVARRGHHSFRETEGWDEPA